MQSAAPRSWRSRRPIPRCMREVNIHMSWLIRRRRLPVEGGEELQVARRNQQFRVVGNRGAEAARQQPLLGSLAAVKGDALRILPHPHQAIPVDINRVMRFYRSWEFAAKAVHAQCPPEVGLLRLLLEFEAHQAATPGVFC